MVTDPVGELRFSLIAGLALIFLNCLGVVVFFSLNVDILSIPPFLYVAVLNESNHLLRRQMPREYLR